MQNMDKYQDLAKGTASDLISVFKNNKSLKSEHWMISLFEAMLLNYQVALLPYVEEQDRIDAFKSASGIREGLSNYYEEHEEYDQQTVFFDQLQKSYYDRCWDKGCGHQFEVGCDVYKEEDTGHPLCSKHGKENHSQKEKRQDSKHGNDEISMLRDKNDQGSKPEDNIIIDNNKNDNNDSNQYGPKANKLKISDAQISDAQDRDNKRQQAYRAVDDDNDESDDESDEKSVDDKDESHKSVEEEHITPVSVGIEHINKYKDEELDFGSEAVKNQAVQITIRDGKQVWFFLQQYVERKETFNLKQAEDDDDEDMNATLASFANLKVGEQK